MPVFVSPLALTIGIFYARGVCHWALFTPVVYAIGQGIHVFVYPLHVGFKGCYMASHPLPRQSVGSASRRPLARPFPASCQHRRGSARFKVLPPGCILSRCGVQGQTVPRFRKAESFKPPAVIPPGLNPRTRFKPGYLVPRLPCIVPGHGV